MQTRVNRTKIYFVCSLFMATWKLASLFNITAVSSYQVSKQLQTFPLSSWFGDTSLGVTCYLSLTTFAFRPAKCAHGETKRRPRRAERDVRNNTKFISYNFFWFLKAFTIWKNRLILRISKSHLKCGLPCISRYLFFPSLFCFCCTNF